VLVERLRDKQRRDGTLGLALTAVRQALSPGVLDPIVSTLACRLDSVVVRHGVAIDVSSDALDDTVRARLVSTAHESRERWFVEQYLPRDRPVIELGGGTGFLAAYVDRVLAADTPQIVVAPNPEFRALVTETRDRNDADFELVAGAYDSAERTFDFQPGETVTGGRVVPASDDDVDGVSLARLAERFDGPFSLVADVEGAEHDLLAEEGGVLARQCDTVVVRFHDTEARTVQGGISRLERLGFEVSDRSGDIVAATNAATDGTGHDDVS
jgi:FkbM family methyltransferase